MELPIWAFVLIIVLLIGAIVAIIALYVLHFKGNNNSTTSPRGFQGNVGEIGFAGLRGSQGFQGSIIGPQSKFDPIQFSQFTATGVGVFPAGGVFSDQDKNFTVSYEILAVRISPTTVRRNVTLKAQGIRFIPNTTDTGDSQNLRTYTWSFNMPASIAGSTPTQLYNTYIGVAEPPDNAFTAVLTILTLLGTLASGYNILFTWQTGTRIPVNIPMTHQFTLTFWNDVNIPA